MRECLERLGVDMKYEEPKMDIVLLGQDMLIVTSGGLERTSITNETEEFLDLGGN